MSTIMEKGNYDQKAFTTAGLSLAGPMRQTNKTIATTLSTTTIATTIDTPPNTSRSNTSNEVEVLQRQVRELESNFNDYVTNSRLIEDELEDQLRQAERQLCCEQAETEELRTRVAQLERQVTSVRQELSIRTEQLHHCRTHELVRVEQAHASSEEALRQCQHDYQQLQRHTEEAHEALAFAEAELEQVREEQASHAAAAATAAAAKTATSISMSVSTSVSPAPRHSSKRRRYFFRKRTNVCLSNSVLDDDETQKRVLAN